MPLAARITKDQTAASKRPAMRSAQHNPRITPISSPPTNSILNRKPACSCGGSCPKCQSEQTIQPKLRISTPNDKYEQEADRVADQVMRMPEPSVQRQPEEEEELLQTKPIIQRQPEEEEEEIQTKPLAGQITPLIQRQEIPEEEEDEELLQTKTAGGLTPEVTPYIGSRIQSLQGGGWPLSGLERGFFEPRFGTDFSNVRVHNDARAARVARSVNARAFTHGSDVVFGAGEYSAGSSSSRKLLAHELTHVVQQNGGVYLGENRALAPSPIAIVQQKPEPEPEDKASSKKSKSKDPVWTRVLERRPRLLDKKKASYDIRFNHVLPPSPKGVTQLWQVVDCERHILDKKCSLSTKHDHTIDVVNIGERKKISDQWVWINHDDPCFATEQCKATVGFDDKKSGYSSQTNVRVTASLAKEVLTKMTTPKADYSGSYTFVKQKNCPKCAKLGELKEKYGAPDGEVLKISGLGVWKSKKYKKRNN